MHERGRRLGSEGRSAEPLEMARLLEELQQASPSGARTYDHLAQFLLDWQDARARMDRANTVLLSLLLESWTQNPPTTDTSQLSKLPAGADSFAVTPDYTFEQQLTRLVEGLPSEEDDPDQSTGITTEEPSLSDDGRDNQRPPVQQQHNHGYPAVERRVDSAYRLHLDRKRDEIEKIQEILSQKATEAITQNKEFGALLEIELSALKQANGAGETKDLKQILIGGTKELIKGQRALSDKLRSSKDYLELVKNDSEELRDELDKVRLLSLTDEYTSLPNRRAFMRRLEDEIGRAQRYETPLALAIIDLDKFKTINDKYGHAAGDEVLRWYAQNVLSIFRHHDMVARYGGEEFSVLLPNTNDEGALRALNKVRGRAADSTWDFEGSVLPAPTFSAGLTLYTPGEPPSSIIDRADKALYRAKRLGRNRIEIEMFKVQEIEDSKKPNES